MHVKSSHAKPNVIKEDNSNKKVSIIIIHFLDWFREQQQQVGVEGVSLQLASVFGSKIYLP